MPRWIRNGNVLEIDPTSIGTDYRDPVTGAINWQGLDEDIGIKKELALMPFDDNDHSGANQNQAGIVIAQKTLDDMKADVRKDLEAEYQMRLKREVREQVKAALAAQGFVMKDEGELVAPGPEATHGPDASANQGGANAG